MGLTAFALVAREGGEIALFAFAGTYPLAAIGLGVLAALALTLVVSLLFVRVNLTAIFNLTLAYLILQAGFLLGYGVHEGLSALKAAGSLAADSPLLWKAFDLSKTVLEHKQGAVGLPLFVLVGWYSRPEWIQFILQYGYTVGMFALWFVSARNKATRTA
jgi:high-affinity iron transporter